MQDYTHLLLFDLAGGKFSRLRHELFIRSQHVETSGAARKLPAIL